MSPSKENTKVLFFFLKNTVSLLQVRDYLFVLCSDQPVVLLAVFQVMSLTRKLQSSL